MNRKQGGEFIPPKNKSDMTSHLKKLIEKKRVSVYIDSANLYFSSNMAKMKIDFIHLSHWFRTHCKLTGLNFYTAYDPEEDKQLDFISELKDDGYRIVKKPLKVFKDSAKKGNMDIELAVDCIRQKDMYDTVILLSGDGDFSYLVQALSDLGKDTIILGVGGFTSYELHQEADNYFFLNRIRDVWSRPRKRKTAGTKKSVSKKDSPTTPKTTKPVAKKSTRKQSLKKSQETPPTEDTSSPKIFL